MQNQYISSAPNGRMRSADSFGGINLANGTPLGEWAELQDMDMSAYPALKTCLPYTYNNLPEGITGYTFRNGQIAYTVSDGIYIGGKKTAIDGLSSGEKTLINMGAYIVILPDWYVINTATEEASGVVKKASDSVITGDLLEYNQNQTAPTVSIYKLLYMDVPSNSEALSEYKVGDNVSVQWEYNGTKRSQTLTITSIGAETYSGSGCVSVNFDTSVMSDTMYWYTENKAMTGSFRVPRMTNATMRRIIPELDFCVEYNNRLWGCSSKNHEIYCSKLGDPLQWGDYSGISTDSWTATVGTDGDFTGACVYNGCVLFFKEDCVHSVYGTKASNFTITTYTVRGVQKGSDKSLCISEGMLYYKAPEGIFAFNGSASSRADGKLCKDITDTAVATADDRYIVMITSGGTAYYYDKLHNAWYTRLLPDTISAHNVNGKLYAIRKDSNGAILQVLLVNSDNTRFAFRQNTTPFKAVTGDICRREVFTVIRKVRMAIEEYHQTGGSAVSFAVSASYDGGKWQTIYSYDSEGKKSDDNGILIAPIIPVRCQHIRLMISGTMTVTSMDTVMPYLSLYGIYIDTEEASEIGGKH